MNVAACHLALSGTRADALERGPIRFIEQRPAQLRSTAIASIAGNPVASLGVVRRKFCPGVRGSRNPRQDAFRGRVDRHRSWDIKAYTIPVG